MSSPNDIKKETQALVEYENVTGAVVNRSIFVGLQLGAWSEVLTFPGDFSWSNSLVRILRVSFGLGLQLEKNSQEVQAKVELSVGTWI